MSKAETLIENCKSIEKYMINIIFENSINFDGFGKNHKKIEVLAFKISPKNEKYSTVCAVKVKPDTDTHNIFSNTNLFRIFSELIDYFQEKYGIQYLAFDIWKTEIKSPETFKFRNGQVTYYPLKVIALPK